MKFTNVSGQALHRRRPAMRGFSLLEMMIAISLGLVALVAMMSVYLSSKTAFRRTEELSALQNSARTAFEYIGFDARSAGMLGCQSGSSSVSALGTPTLRTNYLTPIEGFNAAGSPSFALTDVTTTTSWTNNGAIASTDGSSAAIALDNTATPNPAGISLGMAAGSDVLILRGPALGTPLRIGANVAVPANSLSVEVTSEGGGACASGEPKPTCLSNGSHLLVSTCSMAKVVTVNTSTVTGSTNALTFTGTGLTGAPSLSMGTTEAFPLQTVVYYVAQSTNSATTLSLFRHVYIGNSAAGLKQELIEGVENMQILYGEDTTTPDPLAPDYTVDVYRTANAVTKWKNVRSVRVSLLMRPADPLGPGVTGATSAVLLEGLDGVTATFPTTGNKYDRKVFTTTVSLRNQVPFRIAP